MRRFGGMLLLIVGFCLTQLATWVLCVVAAYVVGVYRHTENISGQVPPSFPVIVVWKETPSAPVRAAALWYRDVAAFRTVHRDSGFLIPAADEYRMRQSVSARSEPGEIRAAFSVDRRADGTQRLRVDAFGTGDIRISGWYEARGDSIVAQRWRAYFGPGVGLAAGLVATPLSFLINGGAWWVLFRRRRHQKTAGQGVGAGGRSGRTSQES